MFEKFTDRARRAVVLAQEEAKMLHHNYIGPEHILLGLLAEGGGVAAKALESLGISLQSARQQIEEIIGPGQQVPSGHLPFTPRAKKVLELSNSESLQLGHNYIGTEHLLLGLIRERDSVAVQILIKLDTELNLQLGADLNRVRRQVVQLMHGYQGNEPGSPTSGVTESAPSRSPALDRFGRDLTQGAREGELNPVIGREKEIERVMQVLSRRVPGSPILVGEPGVGKTAVVEGLAQRIARDDVTLFKDMLVYSVKTGSLAESSSGENLFNARLRTIRDEVRTAGDIILFLDELWVQTIDVWGVLQPMLSRGDMRIIGALTPGEYASILKEHPALGRVFVPIHVAELTVGQTIEILNALRLAHESYHRVRITDGALVAAAELTRERLTERRLPGKAIDLVDEAAALCRMRATANSPDLREYDEQITQAQRARETAIETRDYELLATARADQWRWSAAKDVAEKMCGEVGEGLVAEALAIMLGGSPGDAARSPRFPSAAMTDDDREIWGMA
jgi:ATP-dependent Clp protease ATP-binding subunit ClpC